MSRGTYDDFLKAVRQRESSNNYASQNSIGFSGAYQMGELSLDDAGFYNSKDGTRGKNDFIGQWTEAANKMGVNSIGDFLGVKTNAAGEIQYRTIVVEQRVHGKIVKVQKRVMQPDESKNAKEAQDVAVKAFFVKVWGYLRTWNLDQYVGVTIKGVTITESALIGGYHLVGRGVTNTKTKKRTPGLEDYLKSNGVDDPTDSNKPPTHVSEYIRLFNDFEVPFKKGISLSKPKKPIKKAAGAKKDQKPKWEPKTLPKEDDKWSFTTITDSLEAMNRKWQKVFK